MWNSTLVHSVLGKRPEAVMKRILVVLLLAALAVIAFTPLTVSAAQRPSVALFRASDEPTYEGRSLSVWLKIIRDRHHDMIELAFDAIRRLGPQAGRAVPELAKIVSAPFTAIDIGNDSDDVVADKLYDIELRSEAIDALASIGEAAAPSTGAVIQWALTLRVAPQDGFTPAENELFLQLVALDAEYRLRVIAAVTAFGRPAGEALVRTLKSQNVEKRKMAVAILGLDALTLAAHLLRSADCEDKQLAVAILNDMEPVVARSYITQLRRGLVCEAN
jgi:hypothetical protein